MLEHLDQQLFLFLNSLNSPFWDQVMHAISGKLIWAPLYLAILIYLGFRYKRKFLIIILFVILAVTLADQVSVQVFKNTFQRLRPCHEPALQGLIHLFNGECGGKYGFVSSHASNSFNVALLTLMFIKKTVVHNQHPAVGFNNLLQQGLPRCALSGRCYMRFNGRGIYRMGLLQTL